MNKEGITGTGSPAPDSSKAASGAGPKLENLKKKGSGKWGGKRSGSGRTTKKETLEKKGHLELIETHVDEDVEVTIQVDGKPVKLKKPRLLIAMEKLFQIGTKGDGNEQALSKWLDRAVGKPLQGINLSGEIKVEEQRAPTKAERDAARAFRETLRKAK